MSSSGGELTNAISRLTDLLAVGHASRPSGGERDFSTSLDSVLPINCATMKAPPEMVGLYSLVARRRAPLRDREKSVARDRAISGSVRAKL